MKVYYFFDPSRSENEKAVIEAIYGSEIIYMNTKRWLTESFIEPDDILICNSVEELNSPDLGANIDSIVSEYMKIIQQGGELAFDRSTQCNSMFIKTLIGSNESLENILVKCINNYLTQSVILAKYSSKRVFTAKANGNKLGQPKGIKYTTKKSKRAKGQIRKLAREFDGTMTDDEVMYKIGISRNTYYKYKKELFEELYGDTQEVSEEG